MMRFHLIFLVNFIYIFFCYFVYNFFFIETLLERACYALQYATFDDITNNSFSLQNSDSLLCEDRKASDPYLISILLDNELFEFYFGFFDRYYFFYFFNSQFFFLYLFLILFIVILGFFFFLTTALFRYIILLEIFLGLLLLLFLGYGDITGYFHHIGYVVSMLIIGAAEAVLIFSLLISYFLLQAKTK